MSSGLRIDPTVATVMRASSSNLSSVAASVGEVGVFMLCWGSLHLGSSRCVEALQHDADPMKESELKKHHCRIRHSPPPGVATCPSPLFRSHDSHEESQTLPSCEASSSSFLLLLLLLLFPPLLQLKLTADPLLSFFFFSTTPTAAHVQQGAFFLCAGLDRHETIPPR